jgi:hypothetical protein
MKTIFQPGKLWRPTALLLTPILTLTVFTGGGIAKNIAALPPANDTPGATVDNRPPANLPQLDKGLTNKQKFVLLGGAAALYYLYRRHQNAQGQGKNGQYYLSKNGRVYYRDAQHRAHYVTPPQGGIRVPESQAQQYSDFQGYNGRSTGRDLTGLGTASGQ